MGHHPKIEERELGIRDSDSSRCLLSLGPKSIMPKKILGRRPMPEEGRPSLNDATMGILSGFPEVGQVSPLGGKLILGHQPASRLQVFVPGLRAEDPLKRLFGVS